MGETNHIELTKVSKKYGYVYALKNVSFKVQHGEIIGLLGPNGSGKTTLLKLLATLTSPTEGTVVIFGFNSVEDGKEIRQRVGYIAHDSLLYKDLSGEENINFFTQFYTFSRRQELQPSVDQLLNLMKISSWRHEPIKHLSAGLKKRFDLTRAILHDPSLLLLDEPFTGLDVESVDILRRYIKSIKGIKTVFLSTHDIEQATNLCDRIILLKKGLIQQNSSVTDISRENLLSLFSSQ